MRRSSRLCLVVVAALSFPAAAQCEGDAPQPFEAVRALRTLQDRIAAGDTSAYLSYRTELARLGDEVARAPEGAWKDPRNVRAAIALVLGGGDPSILQPLLKKMAGQERALVRAAVAYGENHNTEALEALAEVDARTLDPSLAGHVALVHAELLARKDPRRAISLLADARLLAPGTMIEEAALRRQISLAVDLEDAQGFGVATMTYARRFPRSVHMTNFRRQLAVDIATRGMAADDARRSQLDAAFDMIGPAERLEIYLLIAWEGLKGGSMEVVRWAAAHAEGLSADGSAQQLRARLCRAAALIVTDEFDKAVSTLEAIAPDKLGSEEEALLAASLRIAGQIRSEPKPVAGGTEPPRGATEPQVAAPARSVMAQVDSLLSGRRK